MKTNLSHLAVTLALAINLALACAAPVSADAPMQPPSNLGITPPALNESRTPQAPAAAPAPADNGRDVDAEEEDNEVYESCDDCELA